MARNKKTGKHKQKNKSSDKSEVKKNSTPQPVKKSISNHLSSQADALPKGYHIMAKPTGSRCNLSCEYCFYLEKENLFPGGTQFRMSDEVLEAYIRKYIEIQKTPVVEFVFQGGEPTLMGLDFFKQVIDLQMKYNPGNKTITNSLQTNGTLIDDDWCSFLAENNFLVGLSMDGPEDIHDTYRLDRGGKSSFHKVHNALKLLQKHKVEYNILTCVTQESARRPLDVYNFFKQEGVEFIQFIPIVERIPDQSAQTLKLSLAVPPSIKKEEANKSVTPWTVNPTDWGNFLITIFDRWIRNDVGNVFVMNFEWAAASWAGMPGTACCFIPQCGRSVILEYNGDLYSCDHFVYPDYRLGNILRDNPKHIIESIRQVSFGTGKRTTLPMLCKNCEFLFACWGECPKHRFMTTPDGEPGWNYLCPGYKKYFTHINPYLQRLINILRQGRPAKDIMKMLGPGFPEPVSQL